MDQPCGSSGFRTDGLDVAHDDAVAAAYQFSVGGGILVILISTGLAATQELGGDDSATRAAVEDARSAALLSVALSSSWSWSEGGTSIDTGFIAVDGGLKMEAMAMFKGAQWTGFPNHVIDYPEAQQQWGVEESEHFHLRIAPIDSTTIYDLSGLRVAYIAGWQDVGEIHVDLDTGESMMAEARGQIDASMGAAAQEERAILASLGGGYDDKVHVTANSPTILVDVLLPWGGVVSAPLVGRVGDLALMEGDVFLADVDHLHSSMASRWNDYDVVVIGSGAQAEALEQGSFPMHARQHVDQGGLLVMLGGTTDTDWIEDALVGEASANQQRRTPDLSHPILTWPAAAGWQELERGPAIPAAVVPDSAWQHILPHATGVELALSQQDSLGNGMAVLTSLQPEGPAGKQLITNILAYYARQDLQLDFGEVVPADVSVAGSQRIVWGTDAGGNQVALRAQLLYWGH